MPIFPPVGHIREKSDPSTTEACGGTESVTEGRTGVKGLWVLKAGIESAELELSHANSDVTNLGQVRDSIQQKSFVTYSC